MHLHVDRTDRKQGAGTSVSARSDTAAEEAKTISQDAVVNMGFLDLYPVKAATLREALLTAHFVLAGRSSRRCSSRAPELPTRAAAYRACTTTSASQHAPQL